MSELAENALPAARPKREAVEKAAEEAPGVKGLLLNESQAMVRFALTKGLAVPPDVAAIVAEAAKQGWRALSEDTIKALTRAHRRLATLVSPASPGTILLLDRDLSGADGTRFLGPVPLIRRLLLVATLSLVALIVTSLSPNVDGTPEHFDLLKSHGTILLLNELFVLSAASLGASFSNLFKAHRYVRNATFDPNLESSYWIRFASGVIAGTILAMLLPMWLTHLGGNPAAAQNALASGLGAPALAMIGGFSADLVYRILYRITQAIESLVRGDLSDELAIREQENRARFKEQQIRDKLALVTRLNELQKKLPAGGDNAKIQEALSEFQQKMLDEEDG